MSIPGTNLYRLATTLIRRQPVKYYEYAGRFPDKQRNLVAMYREHKTLYASIQAVQREKYADMGLDFQENYVKIFVDKDIVDLDRDSTGDMFYFGGKYYKMENEKTWFYQDGWTSCIAVEVRQSFPITLVEQIANEGKT